MSKIKPNFEDFVLPMIILFWKCWLLILSLTKMQMSYVVADKSSTLLYIVAEEEVKMPYFVADNSTNVMENQ